MKPAPTIFVEKVGVLARIKATFNTLKIRKMADLLKKYYKEKLFQVKQNKPLG